MCNGRPQCRQAIIINCVWTSLSDAERRKSRQIKGRQKGRQKDDHCVDLKNEKGQPIAALFVCVFLDTKKRKSGSLFICIHYCDNLF